MSGFVRPEYALGDSICHQYLILLPFGSECTLQVRGNKLRVEAVVDVLRIPKASNAYPLKPAVCRWFFCFGMSWCPYAKWYIYIFATKTCVPGTT